MSPCGARLFEPVIISRAIRRPFGTPPACAAKAPGIREQQTEMLCSLFQGAHIDGLWSEEIVFVETFAQSYKSMCCVAGMSLTLKQRTKSILVSHTEENTKEAETTGVFITAPCLLPSWRTTCFPFKSSRGFLAHSCSKSRGLKQES